MGWNWASFCFTISQIDLSFELYFFEGGYCRALWYNETCCNSIYLREKISLYFESKKEQRWIKNFGSEENFIFIDFREKKKLEK